MSYEHRKTKQVIEEVCYNKLPYLKQLEYRMVNKPATHRIADDDDSGSGVGSMLLTAIVVSELLSDNDSPSFDSGSSDSGSFDSGSSDSNFDFGGGSFGGGGSGSDF